MVDDEEVVRELSALGVPGCYNEGGSSWDSEDGHSSDSGILSMSSGGASPTVHEIELLLVDLGLVLQVSAECFGIPKSDIPVVVCQGR